ncbi:unnamed protein product [Allacma fusca]|uniref:Uncharacterized protein n=1 Tax=Allacma fusca TaxID=39272 RepID=A0A8J2PL70_9HEXA|nr:unnamed protein product [Allacma fusca]
MISAFWGKLFEIGKIQDCWRIPAGLKFECNFHKMLSALQKHFFGSLEEFRLLFGSLTFLIRELKRMELYKDGVGIRSYVSRQWIWDKPVLGTWGPESTLTSPQDFLDGVTGLGMASLGCPK